MDRILQIVCRGSDERKWLLSGTSTDPSLLRIENTQKQYVEKSNFFSGFIYDFAYEGDGAFWLTTITGLYRHAPAAWRTPPAMMDIDSPVHQIYEDTQGRIWFDCLNRLAVYENDRWYVSEPYPDNRTSLIWSTKAMCSLPDGRIVNYTSTSRSGKYVYLPKILAFNPVTRKFEYINHPENRAIRTIAPRRDGQLWVQTLEKGDPFRFRLEIYDGDSFKTLPGLVIGKEWKGGYLFQIFETEKGDIWLCGDSGIGLFSNGEYRNIEFDRGIEYEGGAFCVSELFPGRLWFGTNRGGLEYNGKNWSVIKPEISNAPCSFLRGRDGSVWTCTKMGLNRLYRDSWISNEIEEGLPGTTVFAAFEDSKGRFWVGTGNGLVKYDPLADRDSPKTIINPRDNLREIAPDGEARFAFTGIDKWKYTETNRLLYSHRIDRGNWSLYSTNTLATYEGLKPGEHLFEVRTMDRNWNESEPVSWKLTVILPWYKEPGFLAITILTTILTLLFAGYAVNRHFKLRLSYETLRRTQNQLVQSEKMASLGQLVASVAHEINNPINFIKSNIQPLKEYLFGYKTLVDELGREKNRMPEDMQKKYDNIYEEQDLEFAAEDSENLIESFEDGSNRIAKIIADLRLYSRGDEEHFSSFDIQDIINSTLSLLESHFGDRVTIHKEYGNIPPITCSPGQINQVFMNVLKNTADFIDGDGNVHIKTYRENDLIVVQICDDGRGIPPEHLSKVFDPFFTTKPVGSGTGLGLSLSYSVIEQHKGTIAVESAVGKGTTFTVKLPIKRTSG